MSETKERIAARAAATGIQPHSACDTAVCDYCGHALRDTYVAVAYGDGTPVQNYCDAVRKTSAEQARAAARPEGRTGE